MHHPWKFATVVTVALALTACADSAPRGITEPDGLRLTHSSLPPSLDGVFHSAQDLLNDLYACTSPALRGNKLRDLDKIRVIAEAGKWNEVAGLVEKLIKDTDALIAKKEGDRILPECPPYYANAAERTALRNEFVFWLNVFKNQGEFTGGDITAFVCESGADCNQTGAGWRVHIPNGAFDNDVIVIVQPNGGAFPGPETQVGNSWRFDVLPVADANFPWTRYICWEGGDGEPPEEHIVMVRQNDDQTLDYLPTIVELWGFDTCTQYQEQVGLLNSAYKLLAGLPLFPKALDAYSPPRTFGGTSTAASPHWLTIIPPEDPPEENGGLSALCEKTRTYSPSTANAGCRHLARAAECAEGDDTCHDGAIDSFINVVEAQSGKGDLTTEEADELIADAEALKNPPVIP